MQLKVETESFPLAAVFTISRGSKTEARVLTVTAGDAGHLGRGTVHVSVGDHAQHLRRVSRRAPHPHGPDDHRRHCRGRRRGTAIELDSFPCRRCAP